MANVYVQNIGVPRKARNGRIYAGVSFNVTNPYQQAETAAQRHWEVGILTDILSHNVVYNFTTAFPVDKVPVGLGGIKVFKYAYNGVDFIKQDVSHTFPLNLFPWLTFMVNIDTSEDLQGVIIEFMFTE